jgi:hypothetical protein
LRELASLGGTAAGCIVAGLGVGYLVGSAAGALIGLGIGVIAAISTAYVKIKRYL